METAVVVRGRGEIEAPSAVAGPGLAGEGRVEGDDKLAGRVDGVGGKVKGHTVSCLVLSCLVLSCLVLSWVEREGFKDHARI